MSGPGSGERSSREEALLVGGGRVGVILVATYATGALVGVSLDGDLIEYLILLVIAVVVAVLIAAAERVVRGDSTASDDP